DQWINERRPSNETVLEAMSDPRLRDGIEGIWYEEVLPVFDAWGLSSTAERYIESVRDRLLNPWLAHRIADIATNHGEKVGRRIQPLIELADSLSLAAAQPRLRSMLAAHNRLDAVEGRHAS
ncbi:MAG: mannitol dehydrogenase family protein, partial [Paraburkholderia tropica]